MKKVYSFLVAFIAIAVIANAQSQLGELRGTVINGKTKKPLDYASIQLKLNGIVKAQVLSDDEGEFIIKPLQPGEYTMEISYAGYQPLVLSGINIVSDQATYRNVSMTPKAEGEELKTVYIKPKPDLVDREGKGGGIVKDPVKLPTRSANMIANTFAGVDARSGGTPNIRGARADGTAYYIDGVRVQAGTISVPQNAIDQVQVITSGTPAQYGDFTGGAISITTKAPSRQWQRSFEYITASPFYGWSGDNTHYNSLEAYISGPILLADKGRGDKERVLLGFTLAGNATYALDGRQPAVDIYRVKPDVQRRLEETPLTRTATGGFVPTGEYLVKSDLEKVDQRQNVPVLSVNAVGSFAYQPSNNISIRLGYQTSYSRSRGFNYFHSLTNSDNNQLNLDFAGRVYAQFTQNFVKKSDDPKKVKTVSNFYYTARISYERRFIESMSEQHQRNMFDYGHAGTFKTYSARTYSRVANRFGDSSFKFATGRAPGDTLYLSSYYANNFTLIDTAYTFSPSTYNPIKSNYTRTIYDFFNSAGSSVSSLSQLRGLGGLSNGDEPIGLYSNLWASPGNVQGDYSKSLGEVYSLYLMSEASVAPKQNPKARHDLQFGFTYEQQFRRSYNLNNSGGGTNLWALMRLLVNKQFTGRDSNNYTLKFDDFGNFQDTVLFADKITQSDQSAFDKRLREKLIGQGALDVYGNPIDQYSRLDVNSYAPSMYSIDMFTADELLNQGNSAVGYTGYDYKGNIVRGKKSASDFLNDPTNRVLGAYQPVYMAAWLQDKFTFKDLIVRAGVRFDRFDANQVVLKDPYSLVPIYTVGDVRRGNIKGLGEGIPGSIGDDYAVYVDTKSPNNSPNPRITGYRKGNDWFDASGNPVTDPSTLWREAQRLNVNAEGRNIPFLVTDKQEQPTASSFRDYKPDVTLSPRVWFSFPISTSSQFFGTYDVLVQRPTESNVAQIDDYFYLNNRLTGIIANPDLRMTKVTDYEIGFTQQVGDNSAIKIVTSYREFRNLIQLYRFVQAYPYDYTSFGNLDFSTVKSFRLEYELRDLGNVNLSANYALQFAEGTGSNSQSSSSLVQVGLPTLRNVFPMDFDTRHILKGIFDYHYREGKDYNGPIVNGKKIFENAGINLIFNYSSGRPYTQNLTAIPEVQAGTSARSQVKGTINGSNLPSQFFMDLNVDKNFMLKKKAVDGKETIYRIRVFLWVQNLLNATNVLGVYRYTGSAYDDGFLSSPQAQEQTRVATNAQSFVDLYNIRLVNPGNFATPRLTRIGVSLYF